MDSRQILHMLQLSDGLFPIGAFAFSDGLETVVQRDEVITSAHFLVWFKHYVEAVFKESEGPAILQAMEFFPKDWTRLQNLDHELTALRPSFEMRVSSHSLGLRLLKTCVVMHPAQVLTDLLERIDSGAFHGNIALVHGAVFRELGCGEREALLSFVYSRLSGAVSAALRLASVGQQEMQKVLSEVLECVPLTVEQVIESPSKSMTSFVPMMDVSQMEHRHLYSRLFRS